MHPRRDRGRMKDNRAATARRRRTRAASPERLDHCASAQPAARRRPQTRTPKQPSSSRMLRHRISCQGKRPVSVNAIVCFAGNVTPRAGIRTVRGAIATDRVDQPRAALCALRCQARPATRASLTMGSDAFARQLRAIFSASTRSVLFNCALRFMR